MDDALLFSGIGRLFDLLFDVPLFGGKYEVSDLSAAIRYFYYTILVSHIILAVYVPVGAVITIYYGLKDNRVKHRKWARVTFPIWLYVSVTGVIVYLMLYQIYPPVEVARFFAGPAWLGGL